MSEHDEFEELLQEVLDAQSYVTSYIERGMLHRLGAADARLATAKRCLRTMFAQMATDPDTESAQVSSKLT